MCIVTKTSFFYFKITFSRIAEVKDELEERMAEIKKTSQKVRQRLKGKFTILIRLLVYELLVK